MDIDTVLPIYKPTGITSNDAVELVKKRLIGLGYRKNIKVGHGGTLDKDACGVLVIGVGDGCKKMQQYLKSDKRYIVMGLIGIETDTLDASGKTVRSDSKRIDQTDIGTCLMKFEGEIEQIPPAYSAIKIKGKRMSELMREGKKFDIKPRKVVIHQVKLLNVKENVFILDVICGGGTYMRSLVRDIGHSVGSCAHMIGLTRVKHGDFEEKDVVPIDKLSTCDLMKFAIKKQTP